MNRSFNNHIVCPWCNKGEVLTDGKSQVSISIQCPKCGKIYIGDLGTLKVYRGKACRRNNS